MRARVLVAALTAIPVLAAAASGPAAAFDCAKASTPTERRICAEPALKALDDAMGTAYSSLSARIDPAMKEALLTSQRNFIAGREYCGDDDTYALACISDRTLQRLRFLEGGIEPGALTGDAPALEPFLLQQEGDVAKGLQTVDHAVTLFSAPATPGETAFNAALRAMASEAVMGVDPDLKEFGGVAPWESLVTSRITLLRPGIVSAEIETYEYTGGAHGLGGVSSVSFRRDTGEELSVPALIGEAGVAALFPLCRRQILDVKTERDPAYDVTQDMNYTDDAVRSGLAEPTAWRLEPGKATVTYNSYAVASYAEGRFECVFPAELLLSLSGGALDLR